VRDLKTQNLPAKTLAIFAVPVYSSSDVRIQEKGKATNIRRRDGDLPCLFASGLEADKIASFVPSRNLLLKTNFEASRNSFFTSGLNNYRILHFAAHTFINDRQPELSSIALSFYNREGKEILALLRPNNILRLSLNADLVVLIASQSGLGKQIKGEGSVLIGRFFFSAGAHRLIVSLWNVDDKVTTELMSRFYQKHLVEEKNISISLREAQLEILPDTRRKTPFYWAAFTLEGDWYKLI
jgi:CHAT domain-containing protein